MLPFILIPQIQFLLILEGNAKILLNPLVGSGVKMKQTRIEWSRVLGIALLVFFALEVTLAFGRKLVLNHRISVRLEQTQKELARLEEDNIALRKEKEALHRPEKIEQLAREKLGLVKPNEIAIRIIRKERRTHIHGF